MYTKNDVLNLVEEEDVEFIRLQFTDVFGTMKNMAVTRSQLESVIDHGCMLGLRLTDLLNWLYLICILSRILTPWRYFRGDHSREKLQD